MILRSISCLTLLLGSLSLFTAGCSWGQTPAGDDVASADETNPKSETSGDKGQPADDGLFGNVDNEQPTPAATEQAGAKESAFPEDPNLAAAPTVAEVHQLRERVVALQSELDELRNELRLLREAQVEIVAEEDFSDRALGAMAEDADLRSRMGEMLQGKVLLVNNTGAEQVLYINGTAWTVVEGNSFVYAPVGTVAFQHNGDDEPTFKGIQEWTENDLTGQFEVEFQLGVTENASESSVLNR